MNSLRNRIALLSGTLLFLAIALSGLTGCNKEDVTGKSLRIICEELKPFSFVDDGQLKGTSAEIVGQILGRMGVEKKEIEVASEWDSAYALLQNSEKIALFTTGLTKQRKADFQWVGPIAMLEIGFVGLQTSDIFITTLSDARKLPAVGVVEDYATTDLLENKDFTNLVSFKTLEEAVDGLYQGKVSVVFNLFGSMRMIAAERGLDPSLLEECLAYSTMQGYIAFSRDVSPDLVAAWQARLDELKKEGILQQIFNTYMPGVKAPGLVSIFTEENPSQNFSGEDGEITGSSTELVYAMMSVNGMDDPIKLTTWDNALDQVNIVPNSMVYTMVRTPERENLYQWVGPVGKRNSCFFVKNDGKVKITTLEEAKSLGSIGVPENWASVKELQNLGFTNIVTYNTPQRVFVKLLKGTVDAAVLSDISIEYLAKGENVSPDAVKNELLLSSGQGYLAFSPDTEPEYIQQWQQAYAQIMSDGTFTQIWKKWYPNIDW